MPKTVDTRKRRVESMQQSSATPKNQDVGRGLRKIVACSQPYLAVLSCIYSFGYGVIPTSYFIFSPSFMQHTLTRIARAIDLACTRALSENTHVRSQARDSKNGVVSLYVGMARTCLGRRT